MHVETVTVALDIFTRLMGWLKQKYQAQVLFIIAMIKLYDLSKGYSKNLVLFKLGHRLI